MAKATDLIVTLKRLLKERGISYAALAPRLALSEASVKRMFSQKTFSLGRLEVLCDLLGLELSELARLAEENQPRLSQLTEAQEAALVADMPLLLVAILALNHWRFHDILARYQFTAPALILVLLQLERLNLLQLLPENRIRLKVSRDLQWLADGPVRRFFREKAQHEFLDASFCGSGESLVFVQGMLTPAALAHMQSRVRRIAQEFAEQHRDSEIAPLDERYGCSLLVALRPWELNAFEALRRTPDMRMPPTHEKNP